jgi:hypothetical protein
LLQRALRRTAEVRPWTGEFELTKTYIEALEVALDTSDFAVLVLTPDDLTRSRKTEKRSPRDNVVFELGLFFGRLGRERCFLIQQRGLGLKLPSDLLGIEPAQFSNPRGRGLETVLHPACARIAKAIHDAMAELPSRPRLDDKQRADQGAQRRFSDRIAGTWWERIEFKKERPALSYLTIELDETHSSVRLEGEAYGADGAHIANWRSAAVRLEGEKIVYVRECERLDAKTGGWRPGRGEVTFSGSSDVIDRGKGRFSESDESHPEDTMIKFVKLRRTVDTVDERPAWTMRNGSMREMKALVQKTLRTW